MSVQLLMSSAIVLARERDEERLNNLLFDNNFRIYDLTVHEINGLLKAKEFDKETSKILNQFLNEISKSKIIRVPSYKSHRLYELAELLPRKIVHEAMITMKDSWLQKLIEEYYELANQLTISPDFKVEREGGRVYKIFFNTEFIIKNFIETLYINTALKIGIDGGKIDKKKYFTHCRKHVNSVMNEVLKIHQRNRNKNLNANEIFTNIITELKVFAGKSYKQDIRFVIHTVENATKGYSLDSDVVWLYEFNYHFNQE